MSEQSFLPEGYKAPVSGGYTKIEQGDTRLRILSSPLLVWLVWVDGKCSRLPYDPNNKPAMPAGDNPSVKHAWELIVYNYNTEAIEIFELDKMTLIGPLHTYATDPDWGHPKNYDIVVNKTGSGREGTKYSLIAKPAKPVSEAVKEKYFETPIDLNQLLKEGGNPFLSAPGSASETPQQQPQQQLQQQPQQQAPQQEEDNDDVPF